MSKFKAKPEEMKIIVDSEKGYYSDLNSYQSSVNQVRNSLSFQVLSSENIRSRLKAVSNRLDEEKQEMKRMYNGLSDIVEKYEKTEQKICNSSEDNKITFIEKHDIDAGISLSGSVAFSDFDDLFGKYSNKIADINSKINKDSLNKAQEALKKVTDKYEDLEKSLTSNNKEKKLQGTIDKDGVHKIDQDDTDAVEKFEKSNSVKKSAVLWKAEKEHELFSVMDEKLVDVSEDYYQAQISQGVLNGKASAGVELGYGYAGAEMGACFTALSTELLGQLGNDNLGVYAKGEVVVGKAEAKLEGIAGIKDENGNFNPQAHLGASAEALLAEATVSVGGKLLGADVSGNVGVNFGVGAHAELGIKDWKISFDVGASLGVGVSAEAEIDLSGLVKNIGDFASGCKSAIMGLFD